MLEISASLLAADCARLGEEVKRAELAGADSFHFDMMDGHYVANLALTPQHLRSLRPYTALPFHAHLEVAEPDRVLEALAPMQADLIIVQWDTLVHPRYTFERIRSQGARVGLCLNPDDCLAEVRATLTDIDVLVLLGVYPGFGGQRMLPGLPEKIAEARCCLRAIGLTTPLAVDGGIKPENAGSIVRAGADWLIMGTALFEAVDIAATISSIKAGSASSPTVGLWTEVR